jgi:hypothetical protein
MPLGKIDDLVVPVIAVEAAVGRRVRVAILQGEDLRNQRERFTGERIALRPSKRGRMVDGRGSMRG